MTRLQERPGANPGSLEKALTEFVTMLPVMSLVRILLVSLGVLIVLDLWRAVRRNTKKTDDFHLDRFRRSIIHGIGLGLTATGISMVLVTLVPGRVVEYIGLVLLVVAVAGFGYALFSFIRHEWRSLKLGK
jgi:hypothetical protein